MSFPLDTWSYIPQPNNTLYILYKSLEILHNKSLFPSIKATLDASKCIWIHSHYSVNKELLYNYAKNLYKISNKLYIIYKTKSHINTVYLLNKSFNIIIKVLYAMEKEEKNELKSAL